MCSVVVVQPPFRELFVQGLREGTGEGSRETLYNNIYPARPITTVSLAANTYSMMDGLSSRAPRAMSPRI